MCISLSSHMRNDMVFDSFQNQSFFLSILFFKLCRLYMVNGYYYSVLCGIYHNALDFFFLKYALDSLLPCIVVLLPIQPVFNSQTQRHVSLSYQIEMFKYVVKVSIFCVKISFLSQTVLFGQPSSNTMKKFQPPLWLSIFLITPCI